MKLLFAEDDPDVSRSVTALLTRSHYSVDPVSNGYDALTYLTGGDYDACIMDIMMPGMNGDEVVRKARAAGSQVPVIMLTAMGEVEDRINGLDAGADDYLAKPFDGGELLARIRALLRRHESYSPDVVTYGDLTLNRSTFALSCHEKSVSLSNKAFQMMEMLMLSPGRIISVDEFMQHIWGWDSESEINVVWVNISTLRKQLSSMDSKTAIKVVRGAGYRLEKTDV
ncbi:response regulator transcription factor [Porcincola intestinalis]|jgi:two-component system response regulator ArlR|uniref:response regulator transcription factor n=1 Tax=Porcincola intestinalis TaxID=2606632 RepID=UPI002A82586A|nr:response regulator transcription factor [Porcincola intestinalis]MCI7093666.1 response regulator transcription factor [Lachnospiraceae bacterium]MDY4204122.1 response regulator transcription factor [Porcincola intestinalis]